MCGDYQLCISRKDNKSSCQVSRNVSVECGPGVWPFPYLDCPLLIVFAGSVIKHTNSIVDAQLLACWRPTRNVLLFTYSNPKIILTSMQHKVRYLYARMPSPFPDHHQLIGLKLPWKWYLRRDTWTLVMSYVKTYTNSLVRAVAVRRHNILTMITYRR